MIIPRCHCSYTIFFFAERRHNAGLRFLEGLLNYKVDSPSLVSLICFKVSEQSTRFTIPSSVPHTTSNYLENEPLRRLMSNANVGPHFTFFKWFFFVIFIFILLSFLHSKNNYIIYVIL